MGTASSMGVVGGALGLAWPGVDVDSGRRPAPRDVARAIGERIVALVRDGRSIRTSRSQRRRSTTRCACSARSVGRPTRSSTSPRWRDGWALDLDLDDGRRRRTTRPGDRRRRTLGRGVDGGPRRRRRDAHGLWRGTLGPLLDGATITRRRSRRWPTCRRRAVPGARRAIRPIDDAVDAAGAFRVVRGNLAPDGALIKRSAASASLLAHEGPAIRDARVGRPKCPRDTGPESTRPNVVLC